MTAAAIATTETVEAATITLALISPLPSREFLSREWNGSRSGKRRGQRGEDAEVGVERNALKPSHTDRGQSPLLVLEPTERSFDRGFWCRKDTSGVLTPDVSYPVDWSNVETSRTNGRLFRS
jgi:hypothetical protein